VLERMNMNGGIIKISQYLKSKHERRIKHGELILMNGQKIFFLEWETVTLGLQSISKTNQSQRIPSCMKVLLFDKHSQIMA